jgi:molybdate transport system substrate-binding protein
MPDHCRLIRPILAALWLSATAATAAAQDLTIAAASDLQAVLPQVVTRFERQARHTVRVAFGSSGNFFSQIQNGAPFDLFLSADLEYPRRMEEAALAEPGTLYQYATGKIVLWAPRNRVVNFGHGLQALLEPAVRRIAIANPDHAPYGRAAVAALRTAGLYDRLQSKLVLGENISQAAQFVQSGNADAGILALSLALTPALLESGTYIAIAPSSYPPIEQAAVIPKASRHKEAAREFIQFLKQPENLALMKRFGFETPGPDRR